jgi:hypothetical protein
VSEALRTWLEKLEFLNYQYALATDPAQKFQLQRLISEAQENIGDLRAAASVATTVKPLDLVLPDNELAQRYNSSIQLSLQRSDQAQVGGDAAVRSLPLRKLYISLIADPTSFEESRKAVELQAQLADPSVVSAGSNRDVLRPSLSGVMERLERGEFAGEVRTATHAISSEPQAESAGDA